MLLDTTITFIHLVIPSNEPGFCKKKKLEVDEHADAGLRLNE